MNQHNSRLSAEPCPGPGPGPGACVQNLPETLRSGGETLKVFHSVAFCHSTRPTCRQARKTEIPCAGRDFKGGEGFHKHRIVLNGGYFYLPEALSRVQAYLPFRQVRRNRKKREKLLDFRALSSLAERRNRLKPVHIAKKCKFHAVAHYQLLSTIKKAPFGANFRL